MVTINLLTVSFWWHLIVGEFDKTVLNNCNGLENFDQVI